MKADVGFYDSHYGNFARETLAAIRIEVFGEDIGQNGWLTAEEQDQFLSWLEPDSDSVVLDVACGSGGPTLRIARKTGCRVHGVDIHHDAVEHARRTAASLDLEDTARFSEVDAGARLPFEENAFDGIVCIDAVNHLPQRSRVFEDWFRVLKPGGRLLFTDPIIVTGPLTSEEMKIRSSIGFFIFVPPGVDEALLAEAGFEVLRTEDRTLNMAETSGRWMKARAAREAALRKIEGEDYEGSQRFFDVTNRLARERRLSRTAFLARKPGEPS